MFDMKIKFTLNIASFFFIFLLVYPLLISLLMCVFIGSLHVFCKNAGFVLSHERILIDESASGGFYSCAFVFEC